MRAARDAVGKLAAVADDRGVLVDIELLEEVLAELKIEACGLADPAAGRGVRDNDVRIMSGEIFG